jgi:hypothetical protein
VRELSMRLGRLVWLDLTHDAAEDSPNLDDGPSPSRSFRYLGGLSRPDAVSSRAKNTLR